MKVNELEKMLDIPRANIRFYEKEGLLNPQRLENGYRDYSGDDVECLKTVIVFRKLGFSVSDIKRMLEDELQLQEAVSDHIIELQEKLEELNGALEFCKEIQKKGISIEQFNTEYYWDSIQKAEKKGWRFFDLFNDFVDTYVEYLEFKEELGTSGIFFYMNRQFAKCSFLIVIIASLAMSLIYARVTSLNMGQSLLRAFISICLAYLWMILFVKCVRRNNNLKKNTKEIIYFLGIAVIIIVEILVLKLAGVMDFTLGW